MCECVCVCAKTMERERKGERKRERGRDRAAGRVHRRALMPRVRQDMVALGSLETVSRVAPPAHRVQLPCAAHSIPLELD